MKKFMRKFSHIGLMLGAFVGLLMVLPKCDAAEARDISEQEKHDAMYERNTVEHLRYRKDQRTGLCFAYFGIRQFRQYDAVFTNVPCTDKVEGMLIK